MGEWATVGARLVLCAGGCVGLAIGSLGGAVTAADPVMAAPSATDDEPERVLAGVDLGEEFLLVEDHPVTFDQAYPRLLPSDLAAENRAFAGGHRRRWVSLAAPVSVAAQVVDLTDAESANVAIRSPGRLRPDADALTTRPQPSTERSRTVTGQTSMFTVAAHGRMAVYLSVVGPETGEGDLAALTDEVLAQLTASPHPTDAGSSPAEPRYGDILTGAFSMIWVWYLLGAVIVSARDRILWQRLQAFVLRRRRAPLLVPGATVVSVERTAVLLRWRSAVASLLWWTSRAFATLILLLLLLVAGLGIVSGSIPVKGLVVLIALAAGFGWWRVRRSRVAGHSYRRLTSRLGRPVRVALATTVTVITSLLLVSILIDSTLRWFLDALSLPPEQDMTAGVEIGSGFLVLSLWALSLTGRGVHKVARTGLEQVVTEDGRRPIPLLRSFRDDTLKIRSRRGRRHSLLERMSLRRFDRFEETLAWSLWRHGPVAAAGKPGGHRSSPSFGAARTFWGNEWRERIHQLIDESLLVTVIVGRPQPLGQPDFLAQEIAYVWAQGALSRTVFIVPPTGDAGADERLRYLAELLPEVDLTSGTPHAGRVEVVLALTIDDHRRVTFYTARFRDDLAYALALEQAVGSLPPLVTDTPRRPLPPPARAPRRSTAGQVGRIVLSGAWALVPLTIAWLFITFSVAEMWAFGLDRVDDRPPFSLPGVQDVSPAWGVAADDERVVTFDLTGDAQILAWRPEDDHRFTLPNAPTAAALDGSMAAFAHLTDRRLTILSLGNPAERRTVDVPAPLAVAVADGTAVTISGLDGTMSVVHAGEAVASTLDLGGTPLAVALAGGRAYIVDAADQVVVVDVTPSVSGPQVTERFSVCRGPRDLAVDLDGETITVVCELDRTLAHYRLDGTLRQATPVGSSPFAVARTASGYAVADRGERAVVLVDGDEVTWLHAGSGARDIAVHDAYVLLPAPVDERIFLYDLDQPLTDDTPGPRTGRP